jgi:hypothetical protein
MKAMVETIQFNVGGKHFEVSRALIDGHPDTMLAKMISETWENENNNGKPLFIDRDGVIFRHVLNYLRYGSIDLPPTIPKTMFQRELDYYGITAQESTVKHTSFTDFVNSTKVKLKSEQLTDEMLSLAAECHCKFSRNRNGDMNGEDSVSFHLNEKDPLYQKYGYYKSNKEVHSTTQELVNKYLNEYFGLNVTMSYTQTGHIHLVQYTVSNKKEPNTKK